MKIIRALVLLVLVLPAVAQAWWNKDWKQRTAITLNTTAAGVQTQQVATTFTVPVRLHSGNFDFVDAKQDGSDLRVVAGDDKTPLPFRIERFDSINELGILWVQVPSVLPGSDKNVFYVYAGNDKAPAASGTGPTVFDTATLAAIHFAEKDGVASDETGTIKASASIPIEANGLVGPSAQLAGTPITLPANDKLKIPAGGALTVAVWVKPDTPAAGVIFRQGPLTLSIANGTLSAQLGRSTVTGGSIAPATWSQIVLTIGSGKATLYVNGAQSGQSDLSEVPAIEGPIEVGSQYKGLLDELQIGSSARGAEWVKLAYASQSADAKLVATQTQTSDDEGSESGGTSYFGILFKSLTPDAWVVIGVLGVMFLIAVLVMITKALYVSRTEGANRRFLEYFRQASNILALDASSSPAAPSPRESGTAEGSSTQEASTQGTPVVNGMVAGNAASASLSQFNNSSLYRLYRAGLIELTKRDVGRNGRLLSGASIDAVKAAIDADSVREAYKLNSQMVLLTIAISGGPFLGLLGTVIGVMITFASIAAAGDVNVNAIAPGIAAALLATVAGLGVAIPSLFGYNYLASRIKIISSDMQIFIDEFVTRVAESYGAR